MPEEDAESRYSVMGIALPGTIGRGWLAGFERHVG